MLYLLCSVGYIAEGSPFCITEMRECTPVVPLSRKNKKLTNVIKSTSVSPLDERETAQLPGGECYAPTEAETGLEQSRERETLIKRRFAELPLFLVPPFVPLFCTKIRW